MQKYVKKYQEPLTFDIYGYKIIPIKVYKVFYALENHKLLNKKRRSIKWHGRHSY